MIFKYVARDAQGEQRRGEIETADDHSAVLLIRKKGLIVISVKAKNQTGAKLFDRFFNKVDFNTIVAFTRQLSTMVSAGLVLSEGLDILQEQQDNKRFKEIIADVSRNVKGGLALAAALSRHPDVFPSLYINLVKSGEASGKLDVVLAKMADSLEKDREFRARIKGAMIYPAVVITMMFLVIVIMMVFVIPKLTALFKESTLELPLVTKMLIGISDLFINFWWLIIAIVLIVVISLRHWVKTAEGRFAFDRLLLRVPILGKIITNVTLTNFNRTFGILTSSGVPLLDGINIVSDLTENSVFKQALIASYAGVERGLSFSAQLSTMPIFPRIVGQMIKVGEETGKLDEIFTKLADYFESETDHMVKNLTVAIEPIVLVVLGIGVAFLVISIILPIYKLTTSF